MLRSFLIQLSKAAWAREQIPRWGVTRRVSRRFVAGESPQEAIRAVRVLNRRGILATLDHLGENTETAEDAREAVQQIAFILDQIQDSGVQASVSIKLSQIGLTIDPQLCRENLTQILAHASDCLNFIRIDMEDSSLTSQTLQIYQEARQAGFTNVGIVLQAYLYRTEADLRNLLALDPRIRLCKGAYNEPADLAYPQKRDVDLHYDRLVDLLLEHARQAGEDRPRAEAGNRGRIPPRAAIATHDPLRIEHARAYAERIGLGKDAFEFQMLYGIRRDLQESLAGQGYPVRVYVPYGTHWYPYLMRRMAERPANLWFIVSNYFK